MEGLGVLHKGSYTLQALGIEPTFSVSLGSVWTDVCYEQFFQVVCLIFFKSVELRNSLTRQCPLSSLYCRCALFICEGQIEQPTEIKFYP